MGRDEYVANKQPTSIQLEAKCEFMKRFNLSEDYMDRFSEELKTSVNFDFESFEECQAFRVDTENKDPETNVGFEKNTILEERHEEWFFMDEESPIVPLSHSQLPLYEQLEPNPLNKTAFDNLKKDEKYLLNTRKSSCCDYTEAVKNFKENENICCTRICEDGQVFTEGSGSSLLFDPYSFQTSHKFFPSKLVSEHSILSASSDKAHPVDAISSFFEENNGDLKKIDALVLQQTPGGIRSHTNSYDAVDQSDHHIKSFKTLFTKEHNYSLAQNAMDDQFQVGI